MTTAHLKIPPDQLTFPFKVSFHFVHFTFFTRSGESPSNSFGPEWEKGERRRPAGSLGENF